MGPAPSEPPCVQIISTCAGPHLAASAHSPLLSSEAVAFLHGHLTPKEMALWKTMGEAWTVPRYFGGDTEP